MTTYAEVFQMALADNVVVAVGNEVACAGQALAQYGLANHDSLNAEQKELITHCLSHMGKVQKLAEIMDEYYDKAIVKFGEENPGKLLSIAKEVGESELLAKLQEAVGMTPEESEEMKQRNYAELAKEAN